MEKLHYSFLSESICNFAFDKVSAFVRMNAYKGFIVIDTRTFTENMKISEG